MNQNETKMHSTNNDNEHGSGMGEDEKLIESK